MTGSEQYPAGLALRPHPSCTPSPAPPSSSLWAAGLRSTARSWTEAGT